jgi:hypothetical protein
MRDLYYYDIVSAFPTIMQNQNFNFGDLDLSNKEARNIFIGKKQIQNKNLSIFLNESVKNLTDFYLSINEINDDDVVYRQKDGFIITKPLVKNDMYIEMTLRHTLPILFIDTSKTLICYINESNEIEVKGIRNYYDKLMDVYKRFFDLNFYDVSVLTRQLQIIKDDFVNSKDKLMFGINGDDIQYTFILKNGKKIRTFDPDFVELNEIDRYKYFDYYFKPFMDAIFMEAIDNGKRN